MVPRYQALALGAFVVRQRIAERDAAIIREVDDALSRWQGQCRGNFRPGPSITLLPSRDVQLSDEVILSGISKIVISWTSDVALACRVSSTARASSARWRPHCALMDPPRILKSQDLGTERLSRPPPQEHSDLPRRVRVPLQPLNEPTRRVPHPAPHRRRRQASYLQDSDRAGGLRINLFYSLPIKSNAQILIPRISVNQSKITPLW